MGQMPINQDMQTKSMLDGFNYHALLLRCWQEVRTGGGTEPAWRFSLLHFNGIQVNKGFTCLEDLVDYLHAELATWDRRVTNG